ncbi:MAG: hypothetical protein MR867_00755, partial [Eubacterium sp.]|nr:hypothetical protein [Eubacterium sp.]
VDENVKVTVNGKEQIIKKGNQCTFSIPYGGNGSKNQVVLTDNDTGLCTTYVFHTFGYGVKDPVSNMAIVNAGGVADKVNCSDFTTNSNAPVYTASTNLTRIRLVWSVTLDAGNSYLAELTDEDDVLLDKLSVQAGEEKCTEEIRTKVLTLSPGENTFFVQCHGTYYVWIDGVSHKKDGVHTRVLHIICNDSGEDREEMEDTTLENLNIYMNGMDGKTELDSFISEKYTYNLKIPLADFDEQKDENKMYLKLSKKNDGQKIQVTGGSELYGVKNELTLEENGCYQIARYKKNNLNTADFFLVKICVTAKNGITQKNYTIQITKEGKSGMEIPEIYQNKEYNISYTNPDRCVSLTLASVLIYDKNGNKINPSMAAKEGEFYIQIEDESIISQTGKISSGNFEIRLKKTGVTPVKVIYDDGELHFEDQITVTVRYGLGYLKGEIGSAWDYMENSRRIGRVFEKGAEEEFKNVISQSENIARKYEKKTQLTSSEKDEIHAAVETLIAARKRMEGREIGKGIESFLSLPPEIVTQNVRNDTPLANIILPSSLQVRIGGKEVTLQGITWASSPAYLKTEPEGRRYHFKPVLPAGYVLMEGVVSPEILVIREDEKLSVLVKKTIPLPENILIQHVKIGTKKEELILPNLEMYAKEGTGDSYGRITVPVLWEDQNGFDGNQAGTYLFHSYLNPAYPDIVLYPNTTSDPMQTITVIVDEPEAGGQGDGETGGSQNYGTGSGQGGTGYGTGLGQGSGNGSGQGNGSGTIEGDGSGTENGNARGGQENGNGSLLPAAVRQMSQKGSGGGRESSSAKKKNSESSKKSSGKPLDKKSGEKKMEWNVSEIMEDAPVTYKKEMKFALITGCCLVILGAWQELNRKRKGVKSF